NRRFSHRRALAFSDVVGSTSYFTRFGDVAGRALQQRHLDAIDKALPLGDGRVVDTAGDGAFLCFPDTSGAARALVAIEKTIARQNIGQPVDHRLMTRIGLHWGPVLTDGTIVTGDAVNFCSRIA